MKQRISKWKIIKCIFWIAFGIIVLALVALAIYLHLYKGYIWASWTGFGDQDLWGVLELLILPAVLAMSALWFNEHQNRNDREIAADHQREDALQSYMDKITELLLDKGLRKSEPEDDVRVVARTRTLSRLRALDGTRKGKLLRFLYDVELIDKNRTIIDLSEADLRGIDLYGTDLREANLSIADLSGATVTDKQLASDKSLQGATMPDGKQYDPAMHTFAKQPEEQSTPSTPDAAPNSSPS